MASRKEEKERLRQARLEAEQRQTSADRKRLIVGYVVAGVLTAAVVVGLVIVIVSGDGGGGGGPEGAAIQEASGSLDGVEPDDRDGADVPDPQETSLEAAAEAAGCELMLDLRDEGNTHISPDSEVPDYRTTPPTSGDHAGPPAPQADGAYIETPSPLFYVHSLEHGRVEYQYEPDLAEEAQLEIKGLFLESPGGVLMFPNPDMPYAVAATAWRNLIGCDSYEGPATLEALRVFRNDFRGDGPEPVPLDF